MTESSAQVSKPFEEACDSSSDRNLLLQIDDDGDHRLVSHCGSFEQHFLLLLQWRLSLVTLRKPTWNTHQR